MSDQEIHNYEDVAWTAVEPTIIKPMRRHRFTIIMCHGRGSTGEAFRDEIFESTSSKALNLRSHFASVKWVFPSAGLPFDPKESVNDEAQWFAMSSLQDPALEQIRQRYGISESIKYLHEIIDQEIDTIHGKASRVILGGISQGCAVAIHALLVSQHCLNSFVGFCSWLPFSETLAFAMQASLAPRTPSWTAYRKLFGIDLGLRESITAAHHEEVNARDSTPTQTPCFLSHNTDDDVVDVKLGRSLRDNLRTLGMTVTWDEHKQDDEALKHWIHEPEGIDNLVKFLEKRMGLETVNV